MSLNGSKTFSPIKKRHSEEWRCYQWHPLPLTSRLLLRHLQAEKDKIHCVYQGELTGGEIAAAVRALLPKYMLPNIYHQVPQMPYTPSGKIDRNALKKEYLHDAD